MTDRDTREGVAPAVEGGVPEGQVTPKAAGTVAKATLPAAWGRTVWVGTSQEAPEWSWAWGKGLSPRSCLHMA